MRIYSTIGLFVLAVTSPIAMASEQQLAVRGTGTMSGWSAASMIAAAITLAAAIGLVWAVRRFFFRRQEGPQNDPRMLLRELCKAHGLSRRAERLIRRAALALETPHPGRFFLEPQLLRQAQNCVQLRGQKRALDMLYDRLFANEAA